MANPDPKEQQPDDHDDGADDGVAEADNEDWWKQEDIRNTPKEDERPRDERHDHE